MTLAATPTPHASATRSGPESPQPTRLYALDGLRLLCALAVAGYHFGNSWRLDGVRQPAEHMPHAAPVPLARQIKARAPHCRVILTVNEMKRLGRDAAELTALADHLSARPRPGPGDARRPAARPLRPGRLRAHAVRVLRRDGRNGTREHPRGHPVQLSLLPLPT